MSIAARRAALLVEDNADFCYILSRFLDPWDLEIVTTGTVTGALELVAARRFDCYVIDLRLRDSDSGDLLTMLQRQGEPVVSRCIVVTAFPLVGRALTSLPIVSKGQLDAIGSHLVRILGEPGSAKAASQGDQRESLAEEPSLVAGS